MRWRGRGAMGGIAVVVAAATATSCASVRTSSSPSVGTEPITPNSTDSASTSTNGSTPTSRTDPAPTSTAARQTVPATAESASGGDLSSYGFLIDPSDPSGTRVGDVLVASSLSGETTATNVRRPPLDVKASVSSTYLVQPEDRAARPIEFYTTARGFVDIDTTVYNGGAIWNPSETVLAIVGGFGEDTRFFSADGTLIGTTPYRIRTNYVEVFGWVSDTAFVVTSGDWDEEITLELGEIDADAGEVTTPRRIDTGALVVEYARPAGHNRVFVYSDETLVLADLDVEATALRNPRPVPMGKSFPSPLSPDGTRFLGVGDDGVQLCRIGEAAIECSPIGVPTEQEQTQIFPGSGVWSPDGAFVAFNIDDEPATVLDVVTGDLATVAVAACDPGCQITEFLPPDALAVTLDRFRDG